MIILNIQVVSVKVAFTDEGKMASIGIKLKSIDGLQGHPLNATVSTAFFKTTLLTDVGSGLNFKVDKARPSVIGLNIRLDDKNDLTMGDVARFVEAFQEALASTKLF